MKKKKLKQTNASAHLIQYRLEIREGSSEGHCTSFEALSFIDSWHL